MPKREKFVIIDGNALIHRAFHALPPLTTTSGEVVNAVYGFTSILLKVLKEIKPDYIAATFDLAAPTFRHEEYEEYKATRVKAAQELYDQIPRVKDVVRAFNIPIFEQEGFEADDLIGTVAQKLKNRDIETIIVTGDMDTLQLVDDHTSVYTLKKGLGETTTFGPKEVEERYGLKPDQMVDYKALRGDPSDNIPGVPGIGEKTAAEILQHFHSIDELYIALNKNSKKLSAIKPRVVELLRANEKSARISYRLATIVQNVPIDFSLKACTSRSYDRQKVVDLFQKLEFKSLLTKLPTMTLFQQSRPAGEQTTIVPAGNKARSKAKYTVIETQKDFETFLAQLQKAKRVAVDTETTDLDVIEAKLLGISFCFQEGEAHYVDVRKHPAWVKKLRLFLEDANVGKIGHNTKYDYQILRGAGIEFAPLDFDTMLASYLLNPGMRQHSLDALAFSEFGYEMQSITSLIGKGKNQIPVADVPVEQIGWYSAEDADYTFRLAKKLAPELVEKRVEPLFRKVEMPLVPVLAQMELTGIKVNGAFLKKNSAATHKQLASLEKAIYQDAGREFNINSPAQLKEILFDTLGISSKGIGKTKTGFSTAADELEKLRGLHPIVDRIVEYRELSKIRSTYLEALPELIKKETGRVHTDFNQAVTATGRLSSSNPNLQNIPVRTQLGREIRRAFIADKGSVLLAADYSQLELRIAAALAGDEKMLASFRQGEDIHTRTAAAIHGIPIEKVTKEIRRTAKEVNFGVLYGMGVYGLASRTGLTRDEAKRFIDKYFALYTGVAEYIERTKALARSQGYVETLFGRRRYLPEINAGAQQIRAAAERMAVNMPIQGTAADLIKMAMIVIHNDLPKVSLDSKMLLQVHDELVFEVPTADINRVAQFVKEIMETVEKLSVPIVVDISVGGNWGEMNKLSS